MTLTLNVQLSVVRRGPLDLTAYATRSTVVGNQGVVFWLDGPDLKRIGSEGYEVVWNMNDSRTLTVFPTLETIWPAEYPAAVRAINGLTMGTYRGPICGHCFGGPAGTYTVTCTIRNRAGVAQTILAATITKQDPDTVYAGTNTICYSTSGNFTGAPAGASLVTVADGVITRADFTSNDRRILMRSGETFSGGISLRAASGAYIGAFGGSALAVYNGFFSLDGSGGTPGNVVFDGIKIQQLYNPAAPNRWWEDVPTPTAPSNGVRCVTSTVTGITLHRVLITGASIGIYILGTGNVVFDCGVTDYFDFGCFDLREQTALVGSFIAQNPAALNVNMTAGGNSLPSNRATFNTIVLGDTAAAQVAFPYFGPNGEAPNWPRHGPFRNTTRDAHTINRSALINSLPGWSGHPQSAARFMRDEPGVVDASTAYGSAVDSYLKGGVTNITVNELGSLPSKFVLLDGLTLEADGNAWSFFNFFMGNVWARNILLVMPNGVALDTPQSTFNFTEAGTTTGIAGDGLTIENCTIALRGNLTTRNVGFAASIGGQPVTYRNNLQIRTATNPGSVTIPATTVEVASMTGFNADYSPQAGNTTVIGKAKGVAPVVDMDGRTRGTPGAIGALEP